MLSALSPLIERYHLHEIVTTQGSVPFKESIQKQGESTALLVLAETKPGSEWVLTGKIFEYLGAGRPILAIACKGGEIDQLLKRTGGGILSTEVQEIKEIIQKWLDEFKNYGKIITGYSPDPGIIKQYTRREQARKLAEIFSEQAYERERV